MALSKPRGYGECPGCGKECWLDAVGDEPNLVEIKDRHPIDTDYGPGEAWVEVFRCPACGRLFEERNGYP